MFFVTSQTSRKHLSTKSFLITNSLENPRWQDKTAECQIKYGWNISSWFPTSAGYLGRGAVDYEGVIVSTVSSTSLINPGRLLITRSKWAERKPAHMIWGPLWFTGSFLPVAELRPAEFLFVAASVSVSSTLILSSPSLPAGNSKQALRCKTCKMAAHLWCTSELSQQPCHGKVRIHTQFDIEFMYNIGSFPYI